MPIDNNTISIGCSQRRVDLGKLYAIKGIDLVVGPAKPKSGGFPPWTEDDVARYEARWPIGSKERVWLGVLLYTGLRRSDAVCLGRQQHVRDRVATIRTKKNGVTVTIPILPVLDDILRAGPYGELAFICGERGQPLTKESFGNLFRDACNAAGVKKSAHGVRKIGAIRAALNGATVAELDAIFGWQGGGMARFMSVRLTAHVSPSPPCRSWMERLANKLCPHLEER
jgi:integrase